MINPKLAPLGKIIRDNLRDVPDFPQTGVLFRDISPLLANGEAFSQLVNGLADFYRGRVDLVAGLESRGFLIAAPVAVELGLGTLMIRKAGKLPGPVIGIDYGLEYGKSRMELQPDSIKEGARVLVLDDVLATGGTVNASAALIKRAGGIVESVCVLMELEELDGRAHIGDLECEALTLI